MYRPAVPPPTVERLVRYLVDGAIDEPIAVEMLDWLTASPRFRSFIDLHRDKVRKKLRGARDSGALLDVRAELMIARQLLVERRLQLAFESYGSGRAGPDFTATLANERFNIEVTRIRGAAQEVGFGGLLAKLRQLPPSIPNALIVVINAFNAADYDVETVIRALRGRADAFDDALFVARGFGGVRGFRERLARLGSVFVFAESGAGDARSSAWRNGEARLPFPARPARVCLACLRTEI